MLRQLAHLTRRVPALGPRACALAVYADPQDGTVAAAESGPEGVACVDDAARGVAVLAELWQRTQLDWVRAWAEGLLDFVLAMQTEEGWWINFIKNWDGEMNLTGRTSAAGGRFWHARGLQGVATAATTLQSVRAASAVERAWQCSLANSGESDVRAIELEAGLTLRGRDMGIDDSVLRGWAEEIAACRSGVSLLNWSGEVGAPHLWGHIQEGVLAKASVALSEPRFLEVAEQSATVVLKPSIASGFDLPGVNPYAIAATVFDMDCLAGATGEASYRELARDARAWFSGRNTAGLPVYDRTTGKVSDGIDRGRLSQNSGAEANLCAAEALLDDAVELAQRIDPVELDLPI